MAVQVVFRDGGEVDGAGNGCFVGIVCHAGFHFSESKVELDEVGVEDKLDKAKVDIPGVEGEFMVAAPSKVKSTSKKPKRERQPYHARYTPAI